MTTGIVVVEASMPKYYPRVALARVNILSGVVVRTLRCGEGLPKMFCLAASSLGQLRSHLHDCLRLLFTKRTKWVCEGVEEFGLGYGWCWDHL